MTLNEREAICEMEAERIGLRVVPNFEEGDCLWDLLDSAGEEDAEGPFDIDQLEMQLAVLTQMLTQPHS